uniref:Protein kinase domain-containing protein n=1 Tax=Oryza barthii TaxID=65489 RepID=A0A0D3HAN3_9ORYZ
MEHPSSFYVECEALKSIRHRNLVRVIGLCSTFDTSGFEFKALWINPKVRSQSPPKLLRVAADIATALDYLHNRCTPPLVHCDLKPSNILLNDESFSDFGLAKFLQNNIISLGDASRTTRLRGSIGYIAPEYGLGCKISIEDDVYSYGIIVPEIIIGKRPNFTALWSEDPNHAVVEMQTSIELAKLGLKCTEPSPKDRSTMCDEDDTIVDNELKMNQIATMRIPALQ